MFITGLLTLVAHTVIGGVVGGVVGGAVGGLVGLVIDVFIDDKTIKDTARSRHANEQLKLLIKDKNTRKVDVGIFDSPTNKHLEDIGIETSKGVSDSLYVGQVLYV